MSFAKKEIPHFLQQPPFILETPISLLLTCLPHSAVSRCFGHVLKVHSPTALPLQLCSISELSPSGQVPELAENRAGLRRKPPSQLPKTWWRTHRLNASQPANSPTFLPQTSHSFSVVPKGTWLGGD